jgi:hypothetical protein
VRLWHKRPRFAPPLKPGLQIEEDHSIYDHTPWAWIVNLQEFTDQLENSEEFSNRIATLISKTPGFREGLTNPRS